MTKKLNIIFVGDIVGKPGMTVAETFLPNYLQKYGADFLIVNAENATEGKGVNEADANRIFGMGAHVITTGNHLWDRWDARKLISQEKRILRPLNYPRENAGNGSIIVQLPSGLKIGVINAQGRVFMQPIDDPFRSVESVVSKMRQETPLIIIDFHAEATAEKMAFAWSLDGKVTAVLGTHTHTPTADARVLPNGTAFITDVGMTGPYDSVLGMKKEIAIRRFTLQTPHKFETASDDAHLCAVFIQADAETGRALTIEQIIFPAF